MDPRILNAQQMRLHKHYTVIGTVYYINHRMRKIGVDQKVAVWKKKDTLPIVSELIAETITQIADRDEHILRVPKALKDMCPDALPAIPHIKEIGWKVYNTRGNLYQTGETVWLNPERDPPVSIQTQLLLCVDEALRYYQEKLKESP